MLDDSALSDWLGAGRFHYSLFTDRGTRDRKPRRAPAICSHRALDIELLIIAAVGTALLGWWRYGSLFNPLSFLALANFGVKELASYWANSAQSSGRFDEADLQRTFLICALEAVAIALPFAIRTTMPLRAFGWAMRTLGLTGSPVGLVRFSRARFGLAAAAALATFAGLAVFGGGYTLWLTSPRNAYQFYRNGAGPFFLLTQHLTIFLLAYLLWTARPAAAGATIVALAFEAVAWFSGCKEQMAAVLILSVAYYHFRVARVPTAVLALIGSCSLGALAAVLVVQSGQTEIAIRNDPSLYRLMSYLDFFPNTVFYVSRASEIGPRYGGAMLSTLWEFAPRALFPNKPYDYGALAINALLFPGLAELTFSPALLDWALWHLDFGAAGVLIAALVEGTVMRGAFEYYLCDPENLYAFECALQLGLFPIFILANFPMFLGLLLAQRLALELRLGQPPAPDLAAETAS